MVSARFARFVVGIIGNVISCCLFLSPVPTFYSIWKKKDVEEFQFYPYVATVLNCLLWVLYGLPFVRPDSILVVTINGFGLLIELVYLAIYCYYDKQLGLFARHSTLVLPFPQFGSLLCYQKKVAFGLLGEAVFMAVIILISMLAFKQTKRITFVGVFCDVLNVIMYASPLAIMKKVITTKSVEYMPLYLSVANFLNGCCWTAYALIQFDAFILVSNGLGAISGAAQLILYACYYRTTPKHTAADDVVKPPDIQLSGSDAGDRV